MSSKLKLRILYISLIFLITSLIIYTGIYLNKKNNSYKFNTLLHQIDSSENGTDTMYLYNNALEYVQSATQYKSLLKRFFIKQDFDNMLRISKIAYNRYSSDSQLLSIYLFSLLKSNNSSDALKEIQRLKNKSVNDTFIFETNILTGNVSSEDNMYYEGLKSKDSALFKALYQRTEDSNFLIDSALLYLENGDYSSAESVLKNINLDKSQLNKLLFYVSYYTGQYKQAFDLLSMYDFDFTVNNIKIIQIDILLKQNLYLKADEEIGKFINLYPDYSALPYINSLILNLRNLNNNIKFSFRDVLLKFPNNKNLLLAIVDLNIKNNNADSALMYINNYTKTNPDDPEIDIILKQIKGISNPVNLVNSLYELVNKYPDNNSASRYLAMNLYENNNMQKLEKYLKQLKLNPNKGWIVFYKALLDSFKGNYRESLVELEKSYKLDRHWETLYNLSVVSEQARNYNKAIEYLQKAENSIQDTNLNLNTKSIIRTKLAAVYFDLKDYNKSYREVKNALDQDKDNIQANLLLKKLESVTY